MKKNIVGLLLLAVALPASAAELKPPVVKEGWDWSLPKNVKPVDYSGYITWSSRKAHPAVTVRGVMVTWKRLNPAPGKYDWDWVREQIAKNKADGLRTGLHLKGVQRDAVPDWVVEKLHPVVLDVPPLQDNQPWHIQNVPPWQPKVDQAFHEFLQAFAKTGIAQDENVVYGYIHGISASRGEEMFIRPIDLEMWEKTTGLTAEMFADWLRRRIDAMCDVFKGVEYKLAVMWHGPLGQTPEFREATADLAEYAFRKGAGIRGGGIDFMHVLLDAPAWGASVSDQGYLIVDDEHPTIKGRRFRADENEEYGKYWEWRFGPVAGYPYRHRICCLRGLQLRQNFQMVSDATLELNPELNEYVRITQGYHREDSPDAWAYLRQFDWHKSPAKNIERWLIQRDAPGSQSVEAERIDRVPLPSEKRRGVEQVHDFDARRTDVRNGQTGLLFALDDVFWNQPGPATVKVTYVDNAATSWRIDYTDVDGKQRQTPVVRNTGDGQRKTATFHIPSLSAAGRFPNDAGFRTWLNESPKKRGNVVVNGDFSRENNGWQARPEYRIVSNPERRREKMVEFQFRPGNDDTVHMDQLLPLEKGVAYRLTASIKNDGTRLKPGIRLGRMDWSTIVYLESSKQGEWETLSETFQADADGPVRLQLFGQGRGHAPDGQAGKAYFGNIRIEPVPRKELLGDFQMDFRLTTDGPGDVTVTMVRVVKGTF